MQVADVQGSQDRPESRDVYDELAGQHHILEARLGELAAKPYLSASEELEEHTLKKQKLALKDQMEHLSRELQTRP